MAPAAGLGTATAAVASAASESAGSEETASASAAASSAPSEPAAAANDGSSAGGASPSASAASLTAMSQEVESQLDDLIWLQILRGLGDDAPLVHARLISKRLRELADIVLAERFCARWRVAGVAAPPPAAPAYAAARPASFVLCHRLAGKESLASLAVRYGCDTVELKRLNNLLSDNALACRSHLFIPVSDVEAAASGKRVAFVADEHSKRRLIVLLPDGQELPGQLAGRNGSSGGGQRGSNQAFVVAKLAAVLQRTLRIDEPTATFYISQAGCDVRAAIEKFEEDRRWERVMQHRKGRLRLG